MALQKYRADYSVEPDKNGAVAYYTKWIGGPTLALIRNCPTPFGPRTVYIRNTPDTYFTQPAACKFRNRIIKGFIFFEDGNVFFSANRYGDTVYPLA